MLLLATLSHLMHFLLPAIFVGAVTALFSRRYDKRRSWLKNWLWNSLAGLGALLAGLIIFNVDGKMLSYLMLLVSVSAAQILQLYWRR